MDVWAVIHAVSVVLSTILALNGVSLARRERYAEAAFNMAFAVWVLV